MQLSNILVAVSALLYLSGLLWFFFFSKTQRTTKRLLILTLAIVCAILLLKAALLRWEQKAVVPSGILIDTMQSFSMDSSYEDLTEAIPGTENIWASLSVWYKVLLYSSAPIAFGSVLYDILAGISPELRLLLLGRRRLMVFSELNERTVLLASSLVQHKKAFGPFSIVFTDCYPTGDEEGSELILRAKALQAVCLQSDLLHCRGFRRSSYCNFFLMDLNAAGKLDDQSNLIALKGLLNHEHPVWRKRRGCSVTMFSDSTETIENVRALKKYFEDPPTDKKAAEKKKAQKDQIEKERKAWKDKQQADWEALEGRWKAREEAWGAQEKEWNGQEDTPELKKQKEKLKKARAALKKEKEAREKVKNRRWEKQKKAWRKQDMKNRSSLVHIHMIRDLDMTCCRHLDQVPLFDDLHTPGQTLDVVIFGRSPLAMEMFRSVFWCGQLLEHPLRIAVVATPGEKSEKQSPVLKELLRFNSELLQSCTPKGACLSHELDKVPCADTYASLYFVTEDYTRTPMRQFLEEPRVCDYGGSGSFRLSEATRYFVLTGKDENNVALADELRRTLIYLKKENRVHGTKTISVAVENGEIKDVVSKRFSSYIDQNKPPKWYGKDAPPQGENTPPDWLRMCPFGSLEERYSWEIVSYDAADLAAIEEKRQLDLARHSLPDIGATRDDIYNDWSEVARAHHLRYKMFCAGTDGKSAEASPMVERKLNYLLKLRDAKEQELVQDLRWLEHRRWCAFLRSEGFSQPAKLYAKLNETYRPEKWGELWPYALKNVPSRTHPCLVECLRRPYEDRRMDLLDRVDSLRAQVEGKKLPEKADWPKIPYVKTFDSPDGKYGPKVTRTELAELWNKLMTLYPVQAPGKAPPHMGAWLRNHSVVKDALKYEGAYPLDLILAQLDSDSKKWQAERL